MMAPGNIGNQDSPGAGSRTGVKLFEEIRLVSPQVPILIFTNVSDPSVAQRFEKEKNCKFFRKIALLPHELAAEAQKLAKPVKKGGGT